MEGIGKNAVADGLAFAQSLLSSLAKARGLQSVADAGYSALGNPVIISDKSWTVLAMAPDIAIDSDTAWTEFRRDGMLSITTVSRDIQNGLSEKLNHCETPFLWETEAADFRRILSNVIVGGRNAATITVLEYNHPFSDADPAAIAMLRDAISAEMQKDKFYSYTRGLLHEELLENLLAGRTEDPAMVEYRMNQIDQGMRKCIFVHVLDISGFDRGNHSVPYVRNYLERLIAGSKAVIYDDNIVLVASYDDNPYAGKQETGELAEFMKRHNIRAGVSRSFSNLADLRRHYREAMAALTVGRHMHPSRVLYSYEDYALYHIAALCAENGGIDEYVHPKLSALSEYDRTHESSFTLSLLTYLQCNRNISDTAARLHIHRNTLIYHLKRIEDLLDISLSDTETLLHFELSFKMLEYENQLPD